MKKIYILAFLFLLIILGGCSQSPSEKVNKQKDENIEIFTTIFPLQDFSEKIGGKYVTVENIVPSGSDAHSFEPTTKTMVKIAEGDAFIYLGTGIEGFSNAVIDAVKNEETRIVKGSKGISLIKTEEQGEEPEEHEGEESGDIDPHVWLDPSRSIVIAENIKNALVEMKPDKKEYFEQNYMALKKELESVNSSFKEMVDKSPRKAFIVAHSAYGYWEDAYGLKQIGISGLSPSSEPSQKQLEEIIMKAEEENIQYILFEQNAENQVAKVIEREIGAKTLTLHNLEALTPEDVQNKEDYVSLMQKNIETLRQVLQ